MEFDVTKLRSEEAIDLAQARAEFELLFGEMPTQSTINRWVSRGYKGTRLEAFRVGKKYRTNRSSIVKFVEEINSK